MYAYCLIILLFIFKSAAAQPLPHGMVYGHTPSKIVLVSATKLQEAMAHRNCISTTISGKVSRVTKEKGGWFLIDAGHGSEIEAHFRNYTVYIPLNLKGRNIIAEGIAQKPLDAAAMQHFAGDRPQHQQKKRLKTLPKITFEVSGLMVE